MTSRGFAVWVAWMLVLWPGIADGAELVVWHAYRGLEERALKLAAEAYEESSGVGVDLVGVPFGAFDRKVETAIPRGNGPDVFISAQGNLGKWSAMGLMVPVDDAAAADHRPLTSEALRHDGRLMGVPLAFKTLVLFYDPTLVDEPPRTTDDLIAAARDLRQGSRYGLAYESDAPYFHAPFMHAFGASTVPVDGAVQLDTPQHVAALAFSVELAGLVPLRPTAERVSQLYRDGNAAFVISGPWFAADIDRPMSAVPLPWVSGAEAPARPYLTVEGAFVAAHGDSQEAAQDFVAWLGVGQGARLRQEVGRQAVTWVAATSEDPLIGALIAQAASAEPFPTDPSFASSWEALARALRRSQRGAATPEAAAAEAQAYYDVLSRPPPAPADPTPYLVLLGGLGLLALGALAARVSRPEVRAALASHRHDYLWLLPAGVTVSVVVILPFIVGAGVSLFAHHQGEWTFVGLRHFADILLSRDWPVTSPLSFGFTLLVTVLWTVTNVALHVGIGVALALVLREPWVRLRGVWRAVLILPWAVPNYITALIWRTMFDAQFGAINALLGFVLQRPVELDWFASFSTSFAANLATNTWLGFPFMMVVALGALQSVPRDLEQAAEIDGASYWQRFRHVVWPMLMPAMVPAVVLGSVWTFNMFNVIYLVSGGEPDGGTEILISEAYRWAFSRGNRYGYAAAYAVIIFGILFAYSRGINRAIGRKVL